MAGQGIGDYNVDIVMCIDVTGSMAPVIDEVKKNALSLYGLFKEGMDAEGKPVDQVRVKVILFGDYGCDAEPMVESAFFNLPDQESEFKNFVNAIEPTGGGDIPENALEAIALALKSNWTTGGSNRRHVVAMFTDAPALSLGERRDCANYPSDMPADITQLADWFMNGSQAFTGNYQPTKGRLVCFVPNAEPWTLMDGNWGSRAWFAYSQAGKGLDNLSMQQIVDLIVGSC